MRRAALCLILTLTAALAPSLGAAADRVLLARFAPVTATLFLSRADGSGERPLLTAGAFDYDPAWSPKGEWIAFTSERAGSADLWRVHPDGSGLEQLTRSPAFDDQAAFSPDQGKIVFVSTRAAGFANLWVLDIASGRARPLTSGRAGDFRPSWSPDGRWIAFASDRGRGAPPASGRWERLHPIDIYLIRPDGSGLKRLTATQGQACGSPKWSADSKSVIAYCMSAQETWDDRAGQGDADDRLVRIDVATGRAADVPAGPGAKAAPALLAGGRIGFLRRDAQAKGVNYADGGKGPTGPEVAAPSWSPDGAQVVYSRTVGGRRPDPAKQWSRESDFEIYTTAVLPSVDAPRGRFVTSTPQGDHSTLFVIEDGKPAKPILQHADLMIGPQWSPDGKRIALGLGKFLAFPDFTIGAKKPVDPLNGGAQVAVLNEDGGDLQVLTSGANNNAFPSFAPDGGRIVFRTLGPEGQGLRILDLQTKAVTPLTSSWDNFPLWSPRGDLIAFVRRIGPDFQVFTIRPDGTGLKQLTSGSGNNAHLAWSPDGTRILFSTSKMGFKDEAFYTAAPQPYGEIFLMNADGSHVRQLTDNQWEDGGPAWLPPARVSAKVAAATP